MAVEPASHEPVTQDMEMHVRNYAGFTRLFKWGAIVAFVTGIIVLFLIG